MDFLADPNVACDQGVSAAMGPSSAEEVKRAAERGKFLLPTDRVIRSQTRDCRRVLVSGFRAWLWKEHSVSVHGLLSKKNIPTPYILKSKTFLEIISVPTPLSVLEGFQSQLLFK